MSFDEHARRISQGLADRVKEHVSQELQATLDELQTMMATEHSAAEARMQEQVPLSAVRAADAQLAAIAAAETRGREAARTAGERTGKAVTERVVESIRSLDRAGSLSAILDALTDVAAREAPRIALFTVDGETLRIWKCHGYVPPSAVEIEENGPLAGLLRASEVITNQETLGGLPLFDEASGQGGRVILPIRLGEGVVAVLCAERSDGDRHEEGALESAAILEILTRHAARCLETVTAARTAQLLAGRAEAGRPPIDRGSSPREVRRQSPDEEAESARRYARLLVSEIRLYHEDAVIAGRRDRDLSDRLSGEISRARVLYHQRVPHHVPDAEQFFESELVRTLANGDPSLLGQRSQ